MKMKWRRFSEEGQAIVTQLCKDAGRLMLREAKVRDGLRALRKLGEFSAIPIAYRFILDGDAAVAREASRTLEELMSRFPPSCLPALDEWARAGRYYAAPSDGWPILEVKSIQTRSVEGDMTLFLGLASFAWNGYVREEAVLRLDREVTTGREVPFLLLRLGDWVSVVREAAERAIDRRLKSSNRAAFLAAFPLVARLAGRSRAQASPAYVRIQAFLQQDMPGLLDAAMYTPDSWARHQGLSLVWATAGADGEDAQLAVIERMIKCREPAVRSQAAYWLAEGRTPAALPRRFFPELLHDRLAAVRRVALGWCAAREPKAYLPVLRAALLDPSTIVRAIAQFYLPKYESVDLRGFYRNAITAGEPRTLKAALSGLSETGRVEDVDMIIPYFDAGSIDLRRVALAAIAKLAIEKHVDLVLKALQDASPGISRQARAALESHMHLVGDQQLVTIFASAAPLHVRRQVLALFNRLPKWQKLPLLIEVIGKEENPLKRIANEYLHAWWMSFNKSHQIQPAKLEVQRFREAMSTYGDRLDSRMGRELRALAESLA